MNTENVPTAKKKPRPPSSLGSGSWSSLKEAETSPEPSAPVRSKPARLPKSPHKPQARQAAEPAPLKKPVPITPVKPAVVKPVPRPRAPAPVVDEGMPVIIQDSLNDDANAARNKKLMIIAEIAVVAVGVLAAILLVVGGWWWFRA